MPQHTGCRQAESGRTKDLSTKAKTEATSQHAQGQSAFAHRAWSVTSAPKVPMELTPRSLFVSYVLSPKEK